MITRLTPAELSRFWSKVAVGSSADCWLWMGELNNQGYGRFTTWSNSGRTRHLAHRVALDTRGLLVADKIVRHACDTPRCCNPNHLEVGDQADNMRDAVKRGRINITGLENYRRGVYGPRTCWCGTQCEGPIDKLCAPCRSLSPSERRAKRSAA